MGENDALRIGDAERNAAASALGEHYAAGRLSKDEYDERAERVWSARFDSDLRPVFSDLPQPAGPPWPAAYLPPSAVDAPPLRTGPWSRQAGPRNRGDLGRCSNARPWMVALSILAVGVVVAMVTWGALWLLFIPLWFWAVGGLGFRHMHRRDRVAVARFHGERC